MTRSTVDERIQLYREEKLALEAEETKKCLDKIPRQKSVDKAPPTAWKYGNLEEEKLDALPENTFFITQEDVLEHESSESELSDIPEFDVDLDTTGKFPISLKYYVYCVGICL